MTSTAGEFLVGVNGVFYRLTIDPDSAEADYLNYLAEKKGELAQLTPLLRRQVAERLGGPLPNDFVEPDVVIGEGEQDAVRGWWPATVDRFARKARSEPAASQAAAAPTQVQPSKPLGRRWDGVPDHADKLVAILTSVAAVTPSGQELTRGPLLNPEDLAKFVWYRWPHKPATSSGRGSTPQIWITGPALRAAGMKPPRHEVKSSEELVANLSELFGCRITGSTAGFFTAAFADPKGGIEPRKVKLVLLPFLWLDPSRQRPRDMGIAGTLETPTQLPDDEEDEIEAARELGRRISWLAAIATPPDKEGHQVPRDGAVLPEPRPASVAATLLDRVRRRSRTRHHIDAAPIPDQVTAETPQLDPNLVDWSNMPKSAKGDSIDVEVDQKAAYLASAVQVELGYGTPVEVGKLDPATFAPGEDPPFALCRVTTPAAMTLDGLTNKLPLPHGHLALDETKTFWATTRAVQQLLSPVGDGGAGIGTTELVIDSAWLWPGKSRLLRGWAERIREELAAATEAGDQVRIDICKNMYKAFLGGRLASAQWGPGQRHYQQPVWVATIHADTRWRAIKYATRMAMDNGLYPIRARDIDAFVYRLPAGVDPRVLEEAPQANGKLANGKYRIKWRSDAATEG